MSVREPPVRAPAGPGARRLGARAVLRRLAGHPLTWRPLTWPGLAGLALGLLVLGPALAPGYILSDDMVFVPHAPLAAATLGLIGGPPRAVPSDAVVAALSAVLPADLLQKVILVAIFVASCAGAARLLGYCAERAGLAAGGRGLAGARMAAGVFYAWNPYVAERLIQGHWALLLGYAALPWVVAAVADLGRPARSVRVAALAAALVPAAIGGFEAVGICALAAVPVALAGRPGGWAARGRRLGVTAAALAVASAAWLVPALAVAVRTDPDGALAFAARPDTPFGGAGSLLMLGGIWNAQAVPRGYGGPGAAAWLAVVLAALAGCVLLGARRRACPGLGVAALAAFAVAAIGLTDPGRTALAHLIAAWPGVAVLRDGQQYIAPLALAEAIGIGLGAAWIARIATGGRERSARRAGVALAVMAVLAPVVLLPGLAWGAAGRLHATAYPADWLTARRIIDGDRRGGSVVLLPWAAYRQPGWNDGDAVLDPWTKMLRRPLIWNDALQVGALTVAAEDPAARRLTPALADAALADAGLAGGRPLTGTLVAAGVRYVVVDAGPLLGSAGRRADRGCLAGQARLPGASVVLASADLVVFRLPAAAPPGDAGVVNNRVKGPTCPAADG